MVEKEAGVEIVREVDQKADPIFLHGEKLFLVADLFILLCAGSADACAPINRHFSKEGEEGLFGLLLAF